MSSTSTELFQFFFECSAWMCFNVLTLSPWVSRGAFGTSLGVADFSVGRGLLRSPSAREGCGVKPSEGDVKKCAWHVSRGPAASLISISPGLGLPRLQTVSVSCCWNLGTKRAQQVSFKSWGQLWQPGQAPQDSVLASIAPSGCPRGEQGLWAVNGRVLRRGGGGAVKHYLCQNVLVSLRVTAAKDLKPHIEM